MSDNHSGKQQAGSQSESSASVDQDKRKFLIASSAVGAVGCATAAVPFVLSMTPSERAKAAGAPVEVDVSKIAPGDMMVSEYRGQPLWVIPVSYTHLDVYKRQSQSSQISWPVNRAIFAIHWPLLV